MLVKHLGMAVSAYIHNVNMFVDVDISDINATSNQFHCFPLSYHDWIVLEPL